MGVAQNRRLILSEIKSGKGFTERGKTHCMNGVEQFKILRSAAWGQSLESSKCQKTTTAFYLLGNGKSLKTFSGGITSSELGSRMANLEEAWICTTKQQRAQAQGREMAGAQVRDRTVLGQGQ